MSTRERSTLAERMEQARLRTIAARGHVPAHDHQVKPSASGIGARIAPPPAAARHLHHHARPPSPAAASASAPAPAPSPAAAAHWLVSARPGDHLVLMPGQMHFGGPAATLRTLLGSCVAVTLWHPQRRIGGMCHYLLPSRTRRGGEPDDGRYGDEAIQTMVQMLRQAGTDPGDYHAHLYGGADTMPEGTNLRFNVGERNIEQGWSLIDRFGFQLQGVDVGEDVPRSVTLTLATGEVEMRRGIGKAPPPPTTLPAFGAPAGKPRAGR
jgi:chemotaxis protein CheD